MDRGVLDGNSINANRYPPYSSLKVRFEKRFNFSGSDMVDYLSVWNAYNRKKVTQYFWNEVKDEQGTIYQCGILPVFGTKYEFRLTMQLARQNPQATNFLISSGRVLKNSGYDSTILLISAKSF